MDQARVVRPPVVFRVLLPGARDPERFLLYACSGPFPGRRLSVFIPFLINWDRLTCQLSHKGVVRIHEIIFFKYSEIF